MLGRLGAAGDREAQALLRRAAVVARRDEAGEEGVAGADRRDRLDRRARSPRRHARWSSPSSSEATQPSGRVITASPAPSSTRLRRPSSASSRSLNSWPTAPSASRTFGRHGGGAGAERGEQRLALGVDASSRRRSPSAPRPSAPRRRAARTAAGCRRSRRCARRGPGRAASRGSAPAPRRVTSGPRSLISVCSPEVGSTTARLVLDSPPIQVKSVRIDSSARRSISRAPVGPAGQAGGDHRPVQELQRAGDVDALAAGDGARLDGAVAMALPEARDRDGAVDRGVEGDGEDHPALSSLSALSRLLRILSSCILRLSSGVLCLGACRPLPLSRLAGWPPPALSPARLVSISSTLQVSRSPPTTRRRIGFLTTEVTLSKVVAAPDRMGGHQRTGSRGPAVDADRDVPERPGPSSPPR